MMTVLESLSLRVVRYLCELALGRLELCVVLDVGLDLGVLRQPLVLGGVGHHRGLGLGHVGAAVGQLVEALVVLHVEDHVADLAPEAVLVPHLLQALELLHRVDCLPALGAQLGHPAPPLSLMSLISLGSGPRQKLAIIANCQWLGSSHEAAHPDQSAQISQHSGTKKTRIRLSGNENINFHLLHKSPG